MDPRAAGIFTAQGGAASGHQLLAAGVPRNLISELVRTKELERVREDALVLRSALKDAPPWERRRLRTLAVGHSLASAVSAKPSVHALSHESSLIVQRLPSYGEDGLTHLCRTDGQRGRLQRAIRVHQPIGEQWVHEVDGLRVVLPVMAALQLAAHRGIEPGLVALDGVLHAARVKDRDTTGSVDGPASAAAAEQIRLAVEQGFPKANLVVRQVVELADGRSESPGESRSRWLLHTLGFGPFELQFTLTADGEFIARCDLKLRRWKVIVEFDGEGKYDGHRDLIAEKHREDKIRALGYVVVRLTWGHLANPELVRQKVLQAIALAVGMETAGA